MARLPIPGSDNNQWGEILNDFLVVEHNADGSLKRANDIASALSTAQSTSANLTSHINAADPHAAANYAILGGGGRRIFVQATDPGNAAQDGDIWVDTSL